MRLLVPESPSWLRSPRNASASSIITPTGAMALRMLRIFSRLLSVTPCHLERKLRNFTMGMPISPVKAVTMKLLPVPTGPGDEVAHGQHVEAALPDGLGGAAEALLHEVVARDGGEVVLALDELQQPHRLRLDDLLLLLLQVVEADLPVLLEALRGELVEVHEVQAARDARELGDGEGLLQEELAVPVQVVQEALPHLLVGDGDVHLDGARASARWWG